MRSTNVDNFEVMKYWNLLSNTVISFGSLEKFGHSWVYSITATKFLQSVSKTKHVECDKT